MAANGPCTVARLVLGGAALWLEACSPTALSDPPFGTVSVALAETTEVALFALGPEPSFEPFGGTGEIAVGPPPSATWIARGVPEGPAFLELVGYAEASPLPPSPATFPSLLYCTSEAAARTLSVVSGLREALSLEAHAIAGCPHVALDRVWVTSAYVAQPTDRYNGGARGTNIAHLAIDDCGPGAALEIDVAASGGTPPLGLFAALPDVARGERWPDAASWPVAPLVITADGSGDAQAFVVARPHADPQIWEVEVRGCAGATALARLWVSAEEADQGCASGGCVVVTCPAMAPTGWASSEGGFNSNHAELRCGDDGRGTGGYQLFPGISFDLTSIPAGSVVDRAVMHVYQVRVDGDAPYGPLLQQVEVEQIRYANMWEADEVPAVMGTIGRRPLSMDRTIGWRTAEVTEAVQTELAAGRTRVQLRLSFAPQMADGDAAIDWAVFASDDSPAPNEGLRPWLEVSILP